MTTGSGDQNRPLRLAVRANDSNVRRDDARGVRRAGWNHDSPRVQGRRRGRTGRGWIGLDLDRQLGACRGGIDQFEAESGRALGCRHDAVRLRGQERRRQLRCTGTPLSDAQASQGHPEAGAVVAWLRALLGGLACARLAAGDRHPTRRRAVEAGAAEARPDADTTRPRSGADFNERRKSA